MHLLEQKLQKPKFLSKEVFQFFVSSNKYKKCGNIFFHQQGSIFRFCKQLKGCRSLYAHCVEILNSGRGSKVETEIQNYPNTEMPYLERQKWRFKIEKGTEIAEKFLISGNYWQWILSAKQLRRKWLHPFPLTSTVVTHAHSSTICW